ncbi:laccase-4-like [Primulina huaijiensis]|uniref:laccase-4-like n=1 Tax=Primulina huaijiensis TaxID=1492673 RepID=UPI003CC763CC
MVTASTFTDTPIVVVDNMAATATMHYSGTQAIGLGISPCSTCKAGNRSRVVDSVNNVTFVMPNTGLLQAHYFKIKGIFTTVFPGNPSFKFNYTGTPPSNLGTTIGTKVYRVSYNNTVQVVLQDTGIIAPENHPVRLHGFNFFAVGKW